VACVQVSSSDIRESTIHIGLDEAAVERRLLKLQQHLTSHLTQLTSQIARDRGVQAAPLRAVLVKLGEAEVLDEDIPARLNAAADQLIKLRKRLQANYNSSELEASGKRALALVDRGDLDGARAALSRGREITRALGKTAALDEARILCDEAEIDLLQLAYRAAASKYAETAALVAPFDGTRERELLSLQGRALSMYGENFGDKQAIAEAVALHRQIDQNTSRATEIVGWSGNRINLGNALLALSRYEPKNSRLYEEAISTYRELLQELPSDFPWKTPRVMAHANLGVALSTSIDARKLREAVAHSREALKGFANEDKARWAHTQVNLGNSLLNLGEREKDVYRVREAISAYREALKVFSRNQFPRDWAGTHVNLGNANFALADHEKANEHLDMAIIEYREAIKEITRERDPVRWAETQGNLALALNRIAALENGPKRAQRLKEAMECAEAALSVFRKAGLTSFIGYTEGLREQIRAAAKC
jgi:tetratricopeptide (TPR) repeat protein